MRERLNARRAWLILIVAIAAYEAVARDGELLSEECDRFRARHPILTYLVVGQVALHLLRLLPRNIDLLTWIGRATIAGQHTVGRRLSGRTPHFDCGS